MRQVRVERAVEGVLMGLAWLAGLYAVTPLVGGFGIVDVAQWIVLHSPGWLAAITVDALGFYAKPALVAGVAIGFVAVAAVLRIGWARLPPIHPAVPIGLGVLATAALVLVTEPESAAGAIVGVGIAVLPPYLVTRFLGNRSTAPGRRSFLKRVGSLAAGGVLTLGVLRVGLERAVTPDGADGESPAPANGDVASPGFDDDPPEGGDVEPDDSTEDLPTQPGAPLPGDVSPPRGDLSFSFGRMPSAVTPPAEHYVVDINVGAPGVGSNKPDLDPGTWSLDVGGNVTAPYSLTYEDLLTHESNVEQTMTVICISNRVGGDLVGTSHWTGVPLSDIVSAAEPNGSAEHVVTKAADGFSEKIPLDLVEREDILVAYGMGTRTLSRDHGFPARLLIPGRYGMKMTKWIDRIDVVDDDHESYYEARGWDEQGIVNTMSYLRGFHREDERVTVGGVAFGGLETGVQEIDRVEVSLDGGETWHDAELEEEIAVHAWRRWKYEFESPERQEYEFVCRAVRRDGTVQTSEETSPRPGGATGWHRVTRPI